MSEKTLKFINITLNKKEFHKSKQPIDLMSVNVDQIVVSDKFKHNNEGFKYFIGYQEGGIVKPLCIILPQMSGYIKYFENGGKDTQIWDAIKNKRVVKFHSEPVYDKKYLKTKVREYDGVIKTNFLGNDVPNENMHYTCIACITIDSVMNMDKKNYPQVYLEECKYKIKKIQMSTFINTELGSDSESDSDDKLKSDFDNDSDNDPDNDPDNDSDNDSNNDSDK